MLPRPLLHASASALSVHSSLRTLHAHRAPCAPCCAPGAGAFGVLLTAVLPTTVEDLLAMSLAAMVGYVSILNLPMRRAEAKRKLDATTNAFAQARRLLAWRPRARADSTAPSQPAAPGGSVHAALARASCSSPLSHGCGPHPSAPPSCLQDIQSKMQAELAHALEVCEAEVLAFIEPLEQVRLPLVSVGAWSKGRLQACPNPACAGLGGDAPLDPTCRSPARAADGGGGAAAGGRRGAARRAGGQLGWAEAAGGQC